MNGGQARTTRGKVSTRSRSHVGLSLIIQRSRIYYARSFLSGERHLICTRKEAASKVNAAHVAESAANPWAKLNTYVIA